MTDDDWKYDSDHREDGMVALRAALIAVPSIMVLTAAAIAIWATM